MRWQLLSRPRTWGNLLPLGLIGGCCFAGVFAGLSGCEAVFGEFRRANPENCVNNPGACAADEVCNPVTQLCVRGDTDLPPPDLAGTTDMASPALPASWKQVASGTNTDLFSVWGPDPSNVWAVGLGGVIRKWDGATWSAQSSGTMNNLIDVWGADIKNVWAVGYGGTILRFNGMAWAAQTSNATNNFIGVWGSDVNNIWATGQANTVRKWNRAPTQRS